MTTIIIGAGLIFLGIYFWNINLDILGIVCVAVGGVIGLRARKKMDQKF